MWSMNKTRILDIKPGMNNVNLRVRVLETYKPKTIQTRKGPRTISEAIIGDESGRTKATLWGQKAGTLEAGRAYEIEGAFITGYRGQALVNIGRTSKITRIDDEEVPGEDMIPEDTPRAPMPPRRRGYSRS